MHAQLISYILNLAPIAPIVPMFSSALNSYVLHVSLALFVLSCSLLLSIKVNVFFWFGLVPSKRLKSGTKVITHVFKKFSKSSFVYDVLSVWNVMGSTTFPVFLTFFLYKFAVSFTMVIKISPGGESAGGGWSTSKSTCVVPPWIRTAFGDLSPSSMSK